MSSGAVGDCPADQRKQASSSVPHRSIWRTSRLLLLAAVAGRCGNGRSPAAGAASQVVGT